MKLLNKERASIHLMASKNNSCIYDIRAISDNESLGFGIDSEIFIPLELLKPDLNIINLCKSSIMRLVEILQKKRQTKEYINT